MKKDVMISIQGLQFVGGDPDNTVETLQPGQFYEKNGSRFLLFQEYLDEQEKPVDSEIRCREGQMTLTRRGPVNVQLNFWEGKKHVASYETAYGTMMVGVDCGRVAVKEEENHFRMDVDYTLEANYQYVADCHIAVEAWPAGQGHGESCTG